VKQGFAMVKLKHSEIRVIDEALAMGDGYVLNFSDKTMAEFFDDEFAINIDHEEYRFNGTSKAKRVRAFLTVTDEFNAARVLRRLWKERESIPHLNALESHEQVKARFFEIIRSIESGGAIPLTDAIDRFKRDETLEELVSAIERDIAANKPVAALDRLHTYCMKKFSHLLDAHQIPWDRAEPLHSRFGKYVKFLNQERPLRELTLQILKNGNGVFDKFNHVRNNQSLAHDNEILDAAEARFIYDSITATLRFLKNIELNFEA
jgi:hypothetical protein